MSPIRRRWLIRLFAVALVMAFLGWWAWQQLTVVDEYPGLASGNGRIEAVEIDIAAKVPGRVESIHVDEGEFVTTGQPVATMDTRTLDAELHQAEARLRQASSDVVTARSQVAQREAEKAAAESLLAQRQAELDIAEKRLARTSQLVKSGSVSRQEVDNDEARVKGAAAAVSAARAQIAAAEAAIATARAQVVGTEEAVSAARATIERIEADIADSTLHAPRDGRIQYLVAQPGEVVGAGGRVLNMIDLKDVYMTFFLPTEAVGRIGLGSEARLVIDAAPQYVIPAQISFVSDVAQFTPKTVETRVERQKLMFRVRARLPVDLLERYIVQVKTGLPGVAWVRLDDEQPWPEHLAVRVPE